MPLLAPLFLFLFSHACPKKCQGERRDYPVEEPSLALAFKPLAFPTIVTPYGLATFLVLMTTMQTIREQGVILSLTGAILLLNWVAMIFARPILRLLTIPLELLSWVLGVLQVALGLDLIYIALVSLRVIPTHPS